MIGIVKEKEWFIDRFGTKNMYICSMKLSAFLLLFLAFSLFSKQNSVCYNMLQFNTIRMTYYGSHLIPQGFLEEAKKCNYNYILVEFHFRDKDNSSDPDDVMQRMRVDIKNAFISINKYGLRMIPKIQLGSGWSYHWYKVKKYKNSKIQMNRIKATIFFPEGQKKTVYVGCPSFSLDKEGVDASVEELLNQIKSAHAEAGVFYPLEFVHLGHDEPAFFDRSLIGGIDADNRVTSIGNGWKIKVDSCLERSGKDTMALKNAIETFNGNYTKAYQFLFVSEISNRISQISSILGMKVKLMIYADVFDPQRNGTIKLKCSRINGRKYIIQMIQKINPMLNTGIATLPGLTKEQADLIHRNIILLPWNYIPQVWVWGDSTISWKYNPEITFNYLKHNKFNFVWVHEFSPSNSDTKKQLNLWVAASQRYKDVCLGWNAAVWDHDWAEGKPVSVQYERFNTLSEMYRANKKQIPLRDFSCSVGIP